LRLPLKGSIDLRPPKLSTLRHGTLEPSPNSLANHRSLELGKGAGDLEDELSIGVVVSIACWSTYRSTPTASRCWISAE
jgi:hypothetical protein